MTIRKKVLLSYPAFDYMSENADVMSAVEKLAFSYHPAEKGFSSNSPPIHQKLTEIIRCTDIRSITIVRMEVPCCGGIELAAKKALQASGKYLPWQVVTISIDGKILEV